MIWSEEYFQFEIYVYLLARYFLRFICQAILFLVSCPDFLNLICEERRCYWLHGCVGQEIEKKKKGGCKGNPHVKVRKCACNQRNSLRKDPKR